MFTCLEWGQSFKTSTSDINGETLEQFWYIHIDSYHLKFKVWNTIPLLFRYAIHYTYSFPWSLPAKYYASLFFIIFLYATTLQTFQGLKPIHSYFLLVSSITVISILCKIKMFKFYFKGSQVEIKILFGFYLRFFSDRVWLGLLWLVKAS